MKTLRISQKARGLSILLGSLALFSFILLSQYSNASEQGVDRLIVDTDLCIGCGSCEGIAPDCFVINDDGKAEVLLNWQYHPTQYIPAMIACPTAAIYLTNY